LIAKEEKESLESDRLKREIAEKEAQTAILQERLKDYDPEALKSQQKALKNRLTNVKKRRSLS